MEMVTMGAGRRRTCRCGTQRGVLPVLWLEFVAWVFGMDSSSLPQLVALLALENGATFALDLEDSSGRSPVWLQEEVPWPFMQGSFGMT